MADLSNSLAISASGMRSQTARIRFVSENIANADTPGFQRKIASMDGNSDGTVELGQVRLDQREPARVYDPSHPLAGEDGYYLGTNVNLLTEIADAREAQRSYEANLKMFDQSRQMAKSVFELLRK